MEYRGFTLDNFQAQAIEHIMQSRSVLVSAPTGTGKTIIADYVVDQALKNGEEVVYTAPIKALSNQKYRDYTRLYGKDKVGLVTGDLVINQEAPIRIMTTEILRNILLQQGAPSNLRHVIVDEIHFLDDPERGTVWEEVLIYLPSEVKIVGLSATLSNIDEFSAWLSHVRGEVVEVVKEESRAVPLQVLMANRATGLLKVDDFAQSHKQYMRKASRSRERDSGNEDRDRRGRGGHGRRNRRSREPRTIHLDMIRMLEDGYLPILYFVFSRRQTESFARELGRRIRRSFLSGSERRQVQSKIEEFRAQEPHALTDVHEDLYLKGIAFHHAGIHVGLKALVEDLYESRLVKVLYCTSTFAMGLNMPARTVVFESIRKFNGHQILPLTVRQFMQKAGRAGRRGLDEVGFVVLREGFEHFEEDERFIKRYMRGRHERIDSAFNLSFSSIANLLNRHTESEIRNILDRSFLNYRRRELQAKDDVRLTELRQEVRSLESAVTSGEVPKSQLKKTKKVLRRLERDAADATEQLYFDLASKINYMEQVGYIDDERQFNAGGLALMHIQIEEIFVTELLLSGLFEEVSSDELFGIFTGIVQDMPRSMIVRMNVTDRWRDIRNRIKTVRESKVVVDAEGLQGSGCHFSPELMMLGERWAQGESLNEIMLRAQSETDVAGDLVGAFRRAKDLASQVRQAVRSDELFARRLSDIMRRVSRDEVEVLD